MRTITDHKLNGLNDALTITVLDDPGQGGACHKYAIELGPRPYLFGTTTQESEGSCAESTNGKGSCLIVFQNGPIQEVGVNGISGEALLAVVIDRLRSFQAGQYSCRENAIALTHCEDALMWLQKCTRERLARGVEGTNQK